MSDGCCVAFAATESFPHITELLQCLPCISDSSTSRIRRGQRGPSSPRAFLPINLYLPSLFFPFFPFYFVAIFLNENFSLITLKYVIGTSKTLSKLGFPDIFIRVFSTILLDDEMTRSFKIAIEIVSYNEQGIVGKFIIFDKNCIEIRNQSRELLVSIFQFHSMVLL